MDGAEEDGPDAIGDLFETDELAGEEVGDVDPFGAPTDAPVRGDLSDFEVNWVVEWRECGGVGPGRGLIGRSGCLLIEGFMRPDMVEVIAEGVEALLLRGTIASRRDRGIGLEITVHTFVTPVLLRRSGLDEIRQDPESDPPDAESTESSEGTGCEGHTVV
jgi:hypothetical protein